MKCRLPDIDKALFKWTIEMQFGTCEKQFGLYRNWSDVIVQLTGMKYNFMMVA